MRRRRKFITTQECGQPLEREQSIGNSNEVNQERNCDESLTSFDTINKDKKKTRGYAHMSDVWDLPDGEFVCVEVDDMGNPLGWEGKTLLNAIGSLVRRHQCAPINYLNWKDMPESYINDMIDLIQSKFKFVPELTEQTKEILKDNMSGKWRQFKHYLKSKGYDESKTEEEMAGSIVDTRVDPSQYRVLVHHWCSQEGQTTKAKGVQPSRAEIYIDTRTRKDGSIVTEKAASIIDELKKHMIEEGSSQNPQATQDSTKWKNDIYSKVKGPERRGCVRCIGKLPRRGSSSNNEDNKAKKLENFLGSLVAVLQERFANDPEVNAVLQAVAQEVPIASSSTDRDMA